MDATFPYFLLSYEHKTLIGKIWIFFPKILDVNLRLNEVHHLLFKLVQQHVQLSLQEKQKDISRSHYQSP